MINKTIANWATPRERGFVVGFGLLSTPLGALLTAPVAVGLLSLTGSWRAMFYILGAAGLLVLVLFMRIFTDRPDTNPRVSPAELREIQAARAEQAAAGQGGDAGAAVVELLSQQDAGAEHPGLFLVQLRQLPAADLDSQVPAGHLRLQPVLALVHGHDSLTGACVTVLLGGRISDMLARRTGNLKIARSWFAAGCLLATTLCFLLVSQAQSVFAVIALMTLANALNAMPNSVYWAVVIDTAPASRVGTFSGLMHFFANIASILAPTLTGYLAARHGYSVMFVAASVATAVGMIAMLQVRPGVGPRLPANYQGATR
ncbi:MFS transporter [Achromobacter xylosoxidans]